MKRKIVQHGSSSLTITIPIKWTEKFNIKKGDELNVEESGNNLIVSTQKDISSPKKEIYVEKDDIFTKNNLSHIYQLGYDELEIKFQDANTIKDIKERIPECMGYEIIDQREKYVYIKSIATTLESEFDTLLRKAFLVTDDMARSLLNSLEKQQYSKLSEIRHLESLNNKFTDICIRILNKKGYKVQNRTMQVYEIIKNIERIADEFKYICDIFNNHKKPIDKTILNLFKESIEYYLIFSMMFYKFDNNLKQKLYLGRKPLILKCEKQLWQSKGEQSLLLYHSINIIQKTYEGAGGYFALIL